MSIQINNVVIGGNLTRDVEIKDVGGGRKVATFAIANNRTFVSNGVKNEETSFIDIDVWGAIGENCARYLNKGSAVIVVGRLKQERWKAEDGTGRSRFKIVAQNVQFLNSSGQGKDSESGGKMSGVSANSVAEEESGYKSESNSVAWGE